MNNDDNNSGFDRAAQSNQARLEAFDLASRLGLTIGRGILFHHQGAWISQNFVLWDGPANRGGGIEGGEGGAPVTGAPANRGGGIARAEGGALVTVQNSVDEAPIQGAQVESDEDGWTIVNSRKGHGRRVAEGSSIELGNRFSVLEDPENPDDSEQEQLDAPANQPRQDQEQLATLLIPSIDGSQAQSRPKGQNLVGEVGASVEISERELQEPNTADPVLVPQEPVYEWSTLVASTLLLITLLVAGAIYTLE